MFVPLPSSLRAEGLPSITVQHVADGLVRYLQSLSLERPSDAASAKTALFEQAADRLRARTPCGFLLCVSLYACQDMERKGTSV